MYFNGSVSVSMHDNDKKTKISNWKSYLISSINHSILKNKVIIDAEKIFLDSVIIDEYKDLRIEFKDCVFEHDLFISNCKNLKHISFENCVINGHLIIENCNILNNLYIVNTTITECRLSYLVAKDFKLIASKSSVFSIYNIECKSIDIAASLNIEHINSVIDFCVIRNISVTYFDIKGITVNDIAIYDCRETEHFSIDGLKTRSFKIVNVRNKNVFYLSKIFPLDNSSIFSLVSCNLGKAEMYSIYFDSFREFNISNSNVVDCSFIDIKWKYKLSAFSNETESFISNIKRRETGLINRCRTLFKKTDDSTINYYNKLRETYRQLKYSLSKQGDIINEQKFHSREMRTHYKMLLWGSDFGTKLIIMFSYVFSDFGQSLIRPILWLLGIHLVIFLFLLNFGILDNLYFTRYATWTGFHEGVHQYFYLMNPLRKPDDTFEGAWIIVDIFLRIWSSYMIYNIIRASRRFIK